MTRYQTLSLRVSERQIRSSSSENLASQSFLTKLTASLNVDTSPMALSQK